MPESKKVGNDYSACKFRTLLTNLPAGIQHMLDRALDSFGAASPEVTNAYIVYALTEAGTTGIFNLTGPAAPLTLGGLFATLRDTLSPQATPVWVDEAWLLAQGVAPWSDLPVWLPRAQAALHQVSIARALATGLCPRTLADTVADTATWLETATPPTDGVKRPAVGLAPEREAELLARRPR